MVRNFYYVKSYDGSDPESLNSSGILNGKPEYTETYLDKKTSANTTFSYTSFSTSSWYGI